VTREIERKFFFNPALWSGKPVKTIKIEQGYLAATGEWEIRLRRIGNEHKYTMKTGTGLNRGEWEIPLSSEAFGDLWTQTEGQRLTKVRERFAVKDNTIEVDTYTGSHAGLMVAEVEFAGLVAARRFKIPNAFGPELTYDDRFKNARLAALGSPPCRWDDARTSWSYGVIPFRKASHGLELVLISTRRRDRWIFPKGQPETGLSPAKVALQEAREEAGLGGRLVGHPVVLPYAKEGGTTNLLLFLLEVKRLDSSWLEESQRDRQTVPLAEAVQWGDLAQLGAQIVRNHEGAVGSVQS